MKRLIQAAASLALAGASTLALANEAITMDELDSLLDSADSHGFSHYEEIEVDDSRLELQGWREDGTRLEIDMQLADGSIVEEEEERNGQVPEWSLSGDEVRQALHVARQEGLQRFKELDVDDDGYVEIDGYDGQDREIEMRLSSDGFAVLESERD